MNRFLKYWRITGRGEVFRAQVVTYADDFVILSCGCAAEALDWTRSVMHDLERESTLRQRMAKWAGVAFAAVVVFGGLYYAIGVLA